MQIVHRSLNIADIGTQKFLYSRKARLVRMLQTVGDYFSRAAPLALEAETSIPRSNVENTQPIESIR